MNTEKRKIAVFDVCGTITKTNNTFHFINFVLKKESKVKYLLFKLFTLVHIISVKIPNNNWKHLSNVFFRKISIQLLGGLDVNKVDNLAKYYIEIISEKNLLNESILHILESNRSAKELILISASIDPPIKLLAEKLKIKQFYSSVLGIKDNKYTGKLEKDLRGKKDELIPEISKKFEMEGSVVYSDNREDSSFMNNFSDSYAVIKESFEKKIWVDKGYKKDFLILERKPEIKDTLPLINKKNINLVYIPTFYYLLSRFQSYKAGLLLKEIIPAVLAICLFSNINILESTVIVLMSFLGFYSTYEIGGLFNDIEAKKEKNGNPTLRISNDAKVNIPLFIILRIIILISLFIVFKIIGYQPYIYFYSLLACLLIYLIHTKIKSSARLATFTLLKIFRSACPLLIFFYKIDIVTLILIITTIILLNTPVKFLVYKNKRGGDKININYNNFFIKNSALIFLLGIVISLLFKNNIVLFTSLYFFIMGIIGPLKNMHEIN